MDEKLTRELLDEFMTVLETLETQNLAVVQFIKGQKKGAEKLAPYLDQAERASGVKWMATRARINHLLQAAAQEAEQAKEKPAEKPAKPAEQLPEAQEKRDRQNTKTEEGKRDVGARENAAKQEAFEPSSRTSDTSSSGKRASAPHDGDQAERKRLGKEQSGKPAGNAA